MKALKMKRRRMDQSTSIISSIEYHSLKPFMKRKDFKRFYRKISIQRFNKNRHPTSKMNQGCFK